MLIAAVVASAVVGHGFCTLDPAPGGNHPTAGIDSYVIEIPATKTRQRLFGLRMDGFATQEEARSATAQVKRRLGLDEVLISSK